MGPRQNSQGHGWHCSSPTLLTSSEPLHNTVWLQLVIERSFKTVPISIYSPEPLLSPCRQGLSVLSFEMTTIMELWLGPGHGLRP